MEPVLRNAIARIDIIQGGKSVSRGTGTLVTDRLVVTALHVVADRKATPPAPHPGTIRLTFPTHTTDAVILDERFDGQADWALLRCADPPPVRPVPLGELSDAHNEFASYGFPDAQPLDGMVQRGTVENRHAALFGTPAYQLFSLQAAAGDGAPVKGASGSPVLVDGALVGVLRFALMNERQEARAGTLYACPVPSIVEACDDLLPIPDPCFGLPGLPRRPLPATPVRRLTWFTRADAEIFFGRNREIRQLYDRVTSDDAAPVVLLYGQSGTGKSSFLDAGLLPRLEWTHEVRYLRRERRWPLVASLGAALIGRAADQDLVSMSPSDIVTAWQQIEQETGKPLVTIVDQVEEVYTQPGEHVDEIAGFMRAIEALFGTPGAVRGRVILSFRKEWFPELQKQLEQRDVSFGRVFLEGLDRDAIIEIANGLTSTRRLREHYGLQLQAGLPQLLADDLLADRDSPIAPTLQILLSKLWETATAENRHAPAFTIELYRRMRKEGALLGDFLDQQLVRLKDDDADAVASGLAIEVLAQHTTPLLTARQQTHEALLETYRNLGERLTTLVQAMKDRFLLVDPAGDTAAGASATRLSHDTLAPLVRLRLDESVKPGQRARRLLESRAAQWADGATGAPLDDTDLAEVEKGLDAMRALRPPEERLVAVSVEARRKRRRQRRALKVVLTTFVVAIVALLATTVWQLREASEQRRLNELALTVPESRGRLAVNPVEGLVIAIGALGRSLETDPDPLPQLQLSLNRAMEEAREQELFPFDEPVITLALSADLVAAGTRSGRIHLRDYEGTPIREPFDAHVGPINDLAFSPDGNHLASAGADGAVRVWDRIGTTRVADLSGHPGGAEGVRFTDDAGTLISAGADGAIRVWNVSTGEARSWCHGGDQGECSPANAVTDVAIARDAAGEWILASAGFDGLVRLWTIDGRSTAPPLEGHLGMVNTVDVALDGRQRFWVVSGGVDETVRVWDGAGRSVGDPIRRHRGAVNSVAFDSGGRTVLSGGDDQTVFVLDLDRAGGLAAPPFRGFDAAVSEVAYAPTGAYIALSGMDHTVRLRDYRGNQFGYELQRDSRALSAVAFGPEGRTVAVGGDNGFLTLHFLNAQTDWELNMASGQVTVAAHDGRVEAVAFSADDTQIATGGADGKVYLWSPTDATRIGELRVVEQADGLAGAHDGSVTELIFDPTGRRLITAGTDGRILVWDLPERRLTAIIDAGSLVRAMSVDWAAGLIASSGAEPHPRLWTVAGEPAPVTFSPSEQPIEALLLLPDGRLIAGDDDGHFLVWDRLGNELTDVKAHNGPVEALVPHPDGRSFFSAGADGRVKIWRIPAATLDTGTFDTSELALDFTAHAGAVRALGAGPDGRALASAGADGTVRLWRAHWRVWLEVSCDRLRHHTVFHEGAEGLDVQHNAEAFQVCEREVWAGPAAATSRAGGRRTP